MHSSGDAAHEEEAPTKKKKKEKKAGPPEYLPVDPFTVNLQPGEDGGEQYLQLAFTMMMISFLLPPPAGASTF